MGLVSYRSKVYETCGSSLISEKFFKFILRKRFRFLLPILFRPLNCCHESQILIASLIVSPCRTVITRKLYLHFNNE